MAVEAATTPAAVAAAERALREADLLVAEEEIDTAIETMAARISAAVAGQVPIVMPVLLGGMFAATRLARHFRFACEFDRIQVGRYGDREQGGELEWLVEPSADVRDRSILVVDDILDRGVTLAAVRQRLLDYGAREVWLAALIDKDVERLVRVEADFVGIRCPDRFLFGCGMDFRGHWRELPAIYALTAAS